MIRFSDRVLVGRFEPESDDNRWLKREADLMAGKAQDAMTARWSDRSDVWRRWNVVRLVGLFRRWSCVDLLQWTPIGEKPMPELIAWWRYSVAIDQIDPVAVSTTDPPVLWRGHRVLYGADDFEEKTAALARRRAYSLQTAMERGGLARQPSVGTKLGLERVMRSLRIEFVKTGQSKYELRPIGDDERASA